MEDKIIQLEEVIDVCNKFTNGEMSQENLEQWGDTIKIKLYLPIVEKSMCINQILEECEYNDNTYMKTAQLEMNKFWYILLKYTNINVNDKINLFTIENYDLIYPVIGYWIQGIVEKDYNVVISMLEQSIDYFNILTLIQPLNNLSEMDLKKIVKTDKDILKLLQNPDLVKDLATIAEHDVTTEHKVLIDAIKKETLKDIE